MTRSSQHPTGTPAALVLGLDSHGLSVARALADAGVPVYALERSRRTPGVRSNRVKAVFYVADYSAERLLPALADIRKSLSAHSQVALLAINDRQVEVIARHLPQLLTDYRIAWADQAQAILTLQRKDMLEEISVRQGLNYPKSRLLLDAVTHDEAADLRYPLILKPVRPLSSFKTLLLQSPAELGPALRQYAHDLPILAQEYIAGGDLAIYFGALFLDRGEVVYGMAGRKIASHPPARGQTTIAETVDAPEVLQLTEQFFAGMDLSGPVSLELKRDPDGRYWVIEPTVGRTDFWSELCISAGFNQPDMEFRLACGLPIKRPDHLEPCVWYDTERDPRAYAGLCLSERRLSPRGMRPVFPYVGHGDSGPALRAWQDLFVRLAKRVTKTT